ncbi:hypothetical protein ACSTLO_00135, partial [Vibrio parahaemolyticus]
QGLANQADISRAKVRSLESTIRDLESKSNEGARNEIQLRELQRQADTSRSLYESMLARAKEISEQKDLQQPDARIISR